MQTNLSLKKTQNGFSLMEILVSLFVIMLLIVAIHGLIQLSLVISLENKQYVEAIEIANQRMEYIRNLPYDDVGTVSGSPVGVVPDYSTVSREGIFTIHTTILFHDDPYDGTLASGTDSVFVDYKIATVEVSWSSRYTDKEITIFSKIIPSTEETLAGYGLLKLLIVDSMGAPVPYAEIHVQNDNNGLNVDLTADASGELTYPVLPDIEAYFCSTTKAGYGVDMTYASTAENPNPTKPHLSVFDGLKTEESFTIDRLSTLNIRTVSNTLYNNWQVNEAQSDRDQDYVRIDSDSSDNLYLSWESSNATSSAVYVAKYDSAGNRLWASDVAVSSTNFQHSPDIATLNSGTSFVVWHDNSATLKSTAPLALVEQAHYATIQALTEDNDLVEYWQKYNIESDSLLTYIEQTLPKISIKDAASKIWSLSKIIPARAQAGPAVIVQTKISNVENSANSISATFDVAPTQDNVLIAIAIHRNDWASFSAPTNAAGTFTEAVYSDTSWYMDVGIWYKVAGAAEPSQVTINNSDDIDGGVLMLMEVNGIDTLDPLDVVASNDQTGSNSNTAYTGATAVSEEDAFGIAAFGWGDNNFDTPTSGSYSSDSSNSYTHELWDDWGGWSINDASLAVATIPIDTAASQGCTMVTTGGGGEQRNSVLAVFNLATAENVSVSASGTQVSSITIPDTDEYLGGAFVISENSSNRDVTSITITETGTVDEQNDLSNIRLYYDIDNSGPDYDCSSEQYDAGVDSQFGATGSFSAAATSTFTSAGVNVSLTSTMCVYVVLDVDSGASKDETINIEISDPSQDVLVDSGSAIPFSAEAINGTTNLLIPSDLDQIHYRWRVDDGDEAGASWMDAQDTAISTPKNNIVRLRMAISNEGSLDSPATTYRLEYTDCATMAVWTALPTDNSQHWKIIDASITDADPTTNIAGGLTDENTTFVAGEIKDLSNQTSAITLSGTEFTEIEFAVAATNNALDASYCFRVSDAGSTAGFSYSEYPEAYIVGDNNIYIYSLLSSGAQNWAIKRVNTDVSSEEQTNPVIDLIESGGTATSAVVWEDTRNGNKDLYLDLLDTSGNSLLASDKQLTSSSTYEDSADIEFGNSSFYICWVDSGLVSDNIYLMKYDNGGNEQWSNPVSIAASTDNEYEPQMAIDGSENIYITWTEDNSGIHNVYIAKYNFNGVLQWSQTANLDNAGDEQIEPSIALGSTYIYVSWTDDREGNEDVYVQKYDSSGTAQWSNDIKVNVNLGTSNQRRSSLHVNSSNDSYAAWTDARGSFDDIYATEFYDPLTLVNVPNVPLIITGTKQIGNSPVIYEYVEYDWTDGSGDLILAVEWDIPGYSVQVNPASSSLNLIMSDPVQPMEMLANESKNMILYLE